ETWTFPREGEPPSANELPPKLWAPARILVKKFTVPVEALMLTVNSYVQTSFVPLILRNGAVPNVTPLDVVNVKRSSSPAVTVLPLVLAWSKVTSIVCGVCGPERGPPE